MFTSFKSPKTLNLLSSLALRSNFVWSACSMFSVVSTWWAPGILVSIFVETFTSARAPVELPRASNMKDKMMWLLIQRFVPFAGASSFGGSPS
ncbi:hypothetical protein SUGI_0127990 [Cryptomeria japonica]|nr:hypothetical protein SUGI_0127990 [Cryptomeria japonica]